MRTVASGVRSSWLTSETEVAGGDLLGDVPGALDRSEHPPDGDGRQHDHGGQQPGAHEQQEAGEAGEGLLLEVEGVEEVGLLDALLGLDRGADDQHAAGADGRPHVHVGELGAGQDPVDQRLRHVLEAVVAVGLRGGLGVAEDHRLEAGLASRAPGQVVAEPLLGLGGGQAGGVAEHGGRGLEGEEPHLLDGVVALLGVQGVGQQRVQGGAEQQQRPHHDRRGEQHHPGSQVEPGQPEATPCYP
jgi:hypothetical protein